jgi:hypothetical protein
VAEFEIRKIHLVMEEVSSVLGRSDGEGPLRRSAACAVVRNPYAHKGYVEDLEQIVEGSEAVGSMLGAKCLEAMDGRVESYGKAGIVGVGGEQEHVNAALTSIFGNAFRAAIGGGEAWISSTEKIGPPGTSIDVPLAFKDEIWVRSHYDTITVSITDAPLPDEIVIIAAVANRGRINARVGGMTKQHALQPKST